MKSVSRFEANLLRLLHFFLHQAPMQQAVPLLDARLDRPKCLSRNAVDLVKDTLAKGVVLLLTRAGGWRVERHVRNEEVVRGRLWERTPPAQLGLAFSRNTLDFLLWTAARRDAEGAKTWKPPATWTLGDLTFLYFAYGQLRGHELAGGLLGRDLLDAHGLIWLAYPEDHGKAGTLAQPDLKPWVTGVGACLVEALQPTLADRWAQLEIDKGNVSDWKQMRDIGLAQERVLDALLKSAEHEGRLDLARFLLLAATRVVTASATPQMWTRSLRTQAPRLADRAETYRGALAFLRVLPRLQQWERRARTIGWFDEGYRTSQLWKDDWESFQGDILTERAQAIIRQLDPMKQTEGQS